MSSYDTYKLIKNIHIKLPLLIIIPSIYIQITKIQKLKYSSLIIFIILIFTFLYDLYSIIKYFNNKLSTVKQSKPTNDLDTYYRRISNERNMRIKEILTTVILSFIFSVSICYIINIMHNSDHSNPNISFISSSNTDFLYIPMSIYICSLSIYHYMEFFFVLTYHFETLSWNSFLINQSKQYIFTILFSIAEYLIEALLNIKYFHTIQFIFGLILLILGQCLRITSEFTAKRNFTHQIAYVKLNKHRLIKQGVYKYIRHPSYLGFYCWAVGSQIMNMSYVSIPAFILSLTYFFTERIVCEEYFLIQFFGIEYVEYRQSSFVLLPLYKSLSNEEIDEALIKNKYNNYQDQKYQDDSYEKCE